MFYTIDFREGLVQIQMLTNYFGDFSFDRVGVDIGRMFTKEGLFWVNIVYCKNLSKSCFL